MLTEEQERYFLEWFKDAFYLDDKATIEEIYNNIENEKIRKNRDQLLLEAEKRAIEDARKAVRKIKNKTINQLEQQFGEYSTSTQAFGEELLNEVENDLEKQ